MLALAGVWLLVTFLLPVPGCGRGYLGPGGLANEGSKRACTGGAAAYIDRQLFGAAHISQAPTCTAFYQCVPFDADGRRETLEDLFCPCLA